MKKEEFIKKYGEAAYSRKLACGRSWADSHPEQRQANSQESSRKSGRNYEKKVRYDYTGLQGERNCVRRGHRKRWQLYKQIIAPDSQLHHEWVPRTAEYNGLALVEKDQHQHGAIDVIEILDGEITVFTEQELQEPENMEVHTT